MRKPGLLLGTLVGLCFGWGTGTSFARNDSIPVFPDLVYEYRLAELDKSTPLGLEYNGLVRKYIDIYTVQRRADVSRMLGLSKLYFPVFEHYLDKYDLPLELKYLSVVESGLDPMAKSSSGAMGLWQFLYNSAPMFDLEVSSYIDDRRDVYKSTEAACKYFKYLYQTFQDWHLALAAYNGGPGVVRNAIARSGGKTNLWDLLPYLPEETQNYVPAFLAANYVMHFAQEHHIVPVEPSFSFSGIDTIYLSNAVSFEQIAENVKISVAKLRFLNPRYKLDRIPEAPVKQVLVLPQSLIAPFIEYESRILASQAQKDVSLKPRVHKFTYRVGKGDFLHKIAMKYECSPEDIRLWNRLCSDNISQGQSLVIWVP